MLLLKSIILLEDWGVAEYKCDNDLHVRLVRIGVNDRFGELGSLRYIWKQHGLTAEQIASKIEFLLK